MKEDFDLKEELKKLPDSAGVYQMFNSLNEIIYVGKAKNLKKRVSSYFRKIDNRSPKIEKMIALIHYFEYIVVDNELEALILENNLIKEYQPKFNTLLKNNEQYPFIEVTTEDFPRVLISRNTKNKNSKYFGPFASVDIVKDIVNFFKSNFSVRNCDGDIHGKKKCMYYQMHKCSAPCENLITKEEYNKDVKKIIDILNGNTKDIINIYTKKMYKYSEDLEFEQAKICKDIIDKIKYISTKQKITTASEEDADIIALKKEKDKSIIVVFFLRFGKIIEKQHFLIDNCEDLKEEDVLESFVSQYYLGTPFIPKNIYLSHEINKDMIEDALNQKTDSKISISKPLAGKNLKLVNLALKNADIIIRESLNKEINKKINNKLALKELKELLKLEKLNRIESFDISNTSGVLNVASMIVFVEGTPKKNDYRKFKLNLDGPNDIECLRETLERRFTDKKFTINPDVIFMDGGINQVNIALSVLKKHKLNIPVVGMFKDDKHRTKGLLYNNEEIIFDDKHIKSFNLVTFIQDETHRFAISYHRKLRDSDSIKSVLDNIKGIGEKKRNSLLKTYESVSKIETLSKEDLMTCPLINELDAENIVKFFKENKGEKE